jgi:SAM-dependent methyltransferase
MQSWNAIRKLFSRSEAPPPRVAVAFDEKAYLARYPDVAAAVASGQFESAAQHFQTHGRREGRIVLEQEPQKLEAAKTAKRERFRPLLRTDMPMRETSACCDFLSDELRTAFNIIDTDKVSSGDYDKHVIALIERHPDGLILDCGAGKRGVYYPNVVNFEIVAYDTTDVRGVGEVLPFVDGSFDAVISIAVLEHVKDPFACAAEIARVLKPGGELICCVPFLQPYHGFPHHYYNMSHQGLRNLFERSVEVDRIEVYDSVLPIWSLHWIVQSWAAGLQGDTREGFLDMRVRDLLTPPMELLGKPFVRELSVEKNLELASASVLFGRKKR